MENTSMHCQISDTRGWPAIPANPLLANAYVPLQSYQNLLSPAQALLQGTLFSDLILPYRKSVNSGDLEECLQADLQAVCFAAYDLHLFLNTHPFDQEALTHYRQLTEAKKLLTEEYERKFGPLTAQRAADTSAEYWDWVCGPWPWEKG